MNDSTNTDTQQNIGINLANGGSHLLGCIFDAIPGRQLDLLHLDAAGQSYKLFHFILQAQLFNERAAENGNDQTQHNIDNGDPPAKNAHQQDQATQIDHRRRDQKGKCNTQRKARSGKTDKQRNRRTGTEGCDGAQQCTQAVGPKSTEAAEDLLGALRRKETLNIGNTEDQNPQQNHDLDDIINEELQAAAHTSRRINPYPIKHAAHQAIEPFHAQNFILEKIPCRFGHKHRLLFKSNYIDLYIALTSKIVNMISSLSEKRKKPPPIIGSGDGIIPQKREKGHKPHWP